MTEDNGFNYIYANADKVCTIEHPDSGISISTLLHSPGTDTPTQDAYLGARFSRSQMSLPASVNEIKAKGIDAQKRMKTILNYGHASVANLANLRISLHNISILTEFTLFGLLPIHQGQARSTRYQDYSKGDGIDFSGGNPLYASCHKLLYDAYAKAFEPTRQGLLHHFWPNAESINDLSQKEQNVLLSRTLDCTRYLLPIGAKTSIFLVTTALEWSRLIARLNTFEANYNPELKLIGNMLEDLLLKQSEKWPDSYMPEASGLIKYSTADMTHEALEWLKDDAVSASTTNCDCYHGKTQANIQADALEQLAYRILLIAKPDADCLFATCKTESIKQMLLKLSKAWGELSHHSMLGAIARSSTILLKAYADIGSQRDWIRHKSVSVMLPIANNAFSTSLLLTRPEDELYAYCPYLSLSEELRQVKQTYYASIYHLHYCMVRQLAKEVDDVLLKYALPLGTNTYFTIAGDIAGINYTLKLRIRNGGHIAYRLLAYEWCKQLAEKDAFYANLFGNQLINPVEAGNFEQFVDRS